MSIVERKKDDTTASNIVKKHYYHYNRYDLSYGERLFLNKFVESVLKELKEEGL